MADIDRRGIALGVVLGIFGQAIYDAFFYLISGQFLEEWRAVTSALVAAIILLAIFYWAGFLKEKKAKTAT